MYLNSVKKINKITTLSITVSVMDNVVIKVVNQKNVKFDVQYSLQNIIYTTYNHSNKSQVLQKVPPFIFEIFIH